jgi:hypothetical protein
MPVSIGAQADDVETEIRYSDAPWLTVAASTDPDFELRVDHERALKRMWGRVNYAHTRSKTLSLMQTDLSHVVYFYCHGGVTGNVPYIKVGSPDERGITRSLLRRENIFWQNPRPLVFINGCHTTALEPEVALDLVSGFVETLNAAGVIGTEITIFESLACTFAEECLHHFLHGVPIGEAVRRGRLRLLQDGNPLGLVYDPFVLASLSLVKSTLPPEQETTVSSLPLAAVPTLEDIEEMVKRVVKEVVREVVREELSKLPK